MIDIESTKAIYEIDVQTARKVAVLAQGLAPAQLDLPNSLASVAERLGCIQIDSIQAVRRSQEIVLLSRGVNKSEVGRLYTRTSGLFENWGHAHSLLPQSLYPIFHWRRDRIRKNGLSGVPYNKKVATEILKRISSEGSATHGMLAKTRGAGWDRSSEVKVACEWLLSFGELAVVERNHRWERIYSTPEQAHLPTCEEMSIDESLQKTVDLALEALGIATLKDVYDYFRFPKDLQISQYCYESSFVPVSIKGLKDTWFVSEHLLHQVDEIDWSSPKISIVSPFDSLLWYRPRQLRLFGKDYRLEIYKPADKRKFGYYSMPLLNNENIIGRVAAKVSNDNIKIENLEVDPTVDKRFAKRCITETLQIWTSFSSELR